MHTDHEMLAKRLWAIGDIVRIRILLLLPDSPDCRGGNNVSWIAERLGLAQPTVSHHLRMLRQTGIVKHTRMCRDVFYWKDPAIAAGILDDLRSLLSERQEDPECCDVELAGTADAAGRSR